MKEIKGELRRVWGLKSTRVLSLDLEGRREWQRSTGTRILSGSGRKEGVAEVDRHSDTVSGSGGTKGVADVNGHLSTVSGSGGTEGVEEVNGHSGSVSLCGGTEEVAEVDGHSCAVFSRVEQFVAVPLTPSTNTVVGGLRLPGVDIIHTCKYVSYTNVHLHVLMTCTQTCFYFICS